MNPFTRFLSTFLLVSSAVFHVAVPASASDDVAEVVAGNTQFAIDLYQQLLSTSQDNLFMSPYSVSTALGMTYVGARENTAAQMADALHFTLPPEQFHPAMGELIGQINDPAREAYTLNVANRFWGQQGYPFLPEFLGSIENHYGAGLEELNFIGAPEPSRQTINQWVEEQTNNKIKNLLPQGTVTTDTRFVLTNAIYFLGDWEYPFDRDSTEQGLFHVAPQQSVTIPMMHQEAYFRYGEVDGVQVLELPYKEEELSFIALLPEQIDGLATLEAGLTPGRLDTYLDSLSLTNVNVTFPKFEMTSEFSLIETLGALGMTDAFNPSAADLSGVTGSRDLFINAVVHKAFIQLDEEGTEAAAATGVGGSLTSVPPPPSIFRADHPFCFLIRDNLTDSILFLGRVIAPEASSFEQTSASLPGDLNEDGLVGADDLDLVRAHWGQTVTAGDLMSGDPTGDGIVDGDDLDVIRTHWGATAPAPTPEPGILVQLLLAGFLLTILRRRDA